jgi:hypothetical protein
MTDSVSDPGALTEKLSRLVCMPVVSGVPMSSV